MDFTILLLFDRKSTKYVIIIISDPEFQNFFNF